MEKSKDLTGLGEQIQCCRPVGEKWSRSVSDTLAPVPILAACVLSARAHNRFPHHQCVSQTHIGKPDVC